MATRSIILYLACFVDFRHKTLSEAVMERICTSNSKQMVARNTVDSEQRGTYVKQI